jgi:tetratricopeptide (TPR) repeat protein
VSSEVRSFIRQIDKWFNSDDSRDRALKDLQEAILHADDKNDYQASYSYLMKLGELYLKSGRHLKINAIYTQAALRALAYDNQIDFTNAMKNINPEHPYHKIISAIQTTTINDGKKHFYLLDLEYQTIFGTFQKLNPLPMIDFEDEEEAQIILEDYFPHGYYHVHMIERKTLVRERVDIAVGKKETLDAVETFRRQVVT